MREGQLEAGAADEGDDLEEDSAEADETGSDEEPMAAATAGEAGESSDGRPPRRGRRRGRGRGRYRDEAGGFSTREEGREEPQSGDAETDVDMGDSDAPIEVPEAREPAYAERPNGQFPAEPPSAPALEPEPPPAPALPEPEPVAVVLTPPDPNRPKRAGWWSKAKSAFSGS
jgi:ribonuclease E